MAKNVNEQVKNFIEQAQQTATAAKDQALVDYRQMLESDEGDPKKLLGVMQILGKTAEDLEADAAVIKSAVELQHKADQYQEHREKFHEFSEKIEAEDKAFDAVKEKYEETVRSLRIEASQHSIDLDISRRAESSLSDLKRKHWQLFGLPKPIDSNASTSATLNSLE